MAETDLFKWRHYESEIILLCVRWYLRYALSYRDLEEMMNERGLSVDHTTIYRWVQRYAPELEKRSRPHLRPTNDSYRVDETYVKIKGKWYYLYRAVDSTGQTIDFMLSAKRDARAAKRFFRKMLKLPQHSSPRVINVDQNKTYPPAVEELKEEGVLSVAAQLRQCKYLNNIVEQDHRFIKRRVNPGLGFFSFKTARRTIGGYEVMNMIRKGQVEGIGKGDIRGQVRFVADLFNVAARTEVTFSIFVSQHIFCNTTVMSDEERATDRWENEGGRAFGEVSGESFSSSPANKAQVGAGSNTSQYAPNAFFLKLSNIEQQFIPGWPNIGWKPKKLLLAGNRLFIIYPVDA